MAHYKSRLGESTINTIHLRRKKRKVQSGSLSARAPAMMVPGLRWSVGFMPDTIKSLAIVLKWVFIPGIFREDVYS